MPDAPLVDIPALLQQIAALQAMLLRGDGDDTARDCAARLAYLLTGWAAYGSARP